MDLYTLLETARAALDCVLHQPIRTLPAPYVYEVPVGYLSMVNW